MSVSQVLPQTWEVEGGPLLVSIHVELQENGAGGCRLPKTYGMLEVLDILLI